MLRILKGNDTGDDYLEKKKSKKLGKRWNRLRSGLTPEARRKMEALLADEPTTHTVMSSLPGFDTSEGGPTSLRSAPSSDSVYFHNEPKSSKTTSTYKQQRYENSFHSDSRRKRADGLLMHKLSSSQRYLRENIFTGRRNDQPNSARNPSISSLNDLPSRPTLKNVGRFKSERIMRVNHDQSIDKSRPTLKNVGRFNSERIMRANHDQSIDEIPSRPCMKNAGRYNSERIMRANYNQSVGEIPSRPCMKNAGRYNSERIMRVNHDQSIGDDHQAKMHQGENTEDLSLMGNNKMSVGDVTAQSEPLNGRKPSRPSMNKFATYNSERIIRVNHGQSIYDHKAKMHQHESTEDLSSLRNNKMIVGDITAQSVCSQQLLYHPKSTKVKSKVKIPLGIITIVVTDVQGSTTLWENNPTVMQEALDLHDKIIRRCYHHHNGYEITTEGDSFILAFHHPLDALSFALQAQVDLYNAKWSDRILSLIDSKLDKANSMRGLRVRMGLHHGDSVSYEHEVTKRIFYKGEAMNIAKAVEKLSHGGQILTTVETWRAVSGMAERYLGSPQVVDCGEYDLQNSYDDESFTPKKLIQLVPKCFAYDYFLWRGEKENNTNNAKEGRLFPPLKSNKQTDIGFQDAPYENNEVVLVFIYTVFTRCDLCGDAKAHNAALLSKYIRCQLFSSSPPGYECQETDGQWMLAFHTLESAISFGIEIVKKLQGAPLNVKVGIQKGLFTSQGPHAVTGRADYFGPIVNRAARVASIGEAGQVLLGVPDDNPGSFKLPSSEEFNIEFLRCENLKGVSVSTKLYECSIAK